MCGIVIISAPKTTAYSIDVALNTIAHRGPDDRGAFVSQLADCSLGQNRLSIFDLSPAGHQPMQDRSGRYVIAYNGETYNFSELRTELEQRHGVIEWQGRSDTEVVLEGFALEGQGFLEKLNGIFALAIYDIQDRLLHVLRDPLGIKPLFKSEHNGATLFASELKALLALSALPRTLRRESLAEQLAFMYVPEPNTLYREFTKVSPGVLYTYQQGVLQSEVPMFAHLHDAPSIAIEGEAIEALQETFGRAVDRQSIADVPVSLFLSGGLDSSAVAERAVRSGAHVKDAYTIAFSQQDRQEDAQSDDLHYAGIMAKRLGIELKVIVARPDFLSLLPELSRFMEDGFSDPAAINTYIICEGARRDGVKVMLSGQGADEFLGGYRRYVAESVFSHMPKIARIALAAASRALPAHLPGRFNAINRRAKRLGLLAGQSNADRILGMYTWAKPEAIERLFVKPLSRPPSSDFADMLAKLRYREPLDTLMAIDRHYDLMSLNLCYTDRMSMAVGVEARVPFLDFEMVRVMNAIPSDLKVRFGQGKYVFKKAMEPFLPREIIYREKAGFGLPVRAWIKSSERLFDHYLDPVRLNRQGIFNANEIGQIRREQANSKCDHANTLLTLLVQQMWLDMALVT